MAYVTHPITKEDHEWVGDLLELNKKILGGKLPLVRWARCHAKNDHWVAIGESAFAHFRAKRNGIVTLYEIAVAEDSKRKGMGRALIGYMRGPGPALRPIELKTDAENEESNAFYLGLGMKRVGQKKTKKGKVVNLYMG